MTSLQPTLTDRTVERVATVDVARALAVIGMVLVNFRVVLCMEAKEPAALHTLVHLCTGRASALFVVLAGVGLTLMARGRSARENPGHLRKRVIARAFFLLAVGLAYSPLWPGDILHYYGVYFLIATLLLGGSSAQLWLFAAGVTLAAPILLLFGPDYSTGWNWSTLEYRDFWSAGGFVRNLFYNGFHPVIPWLAFFALGMWLGRQPLSDGRFLRLLAMVGLAGVVLLDIWRDYGVEAIVARVEEIPSDDLRALLGIASMPPTPFYVVSAASAACAVIGVVGWLLERVPAAVATPLAHTGQLALTHYVGHVVLGMGALELAGGMEGHGLVFACGLAAGYCLLAVVFSTLWRRRFARGPLEAVMRKLTG